MFMHLAKFIHRLKIALVPLTGGVKVIQAACVMFMYYNVHVV